MPTNERLRAKRANQNLDSEDQYVRLISAIIRVRTLIVNVMNAHFSRSYHESCIGLVSFRFSTTIARCQVPWYRRSFQSKQDLPNAGELAAPQTTADLSLQKLRISIAIHPPPKRWITSSCTGLVSPFLFETVPTTSSFILHLHSLLPRICHGLRRVGLSSFQCSVPSSAVRAPWSMLPPAPEFNPNPRGPLDRLFIQPCTRLKYSICVC